MSAYVPFLSLIKFRIPAHGMMLPALRMDQQETPSQTASQRCLEVCFLRPIKLAVKIHHRSEYAALVLLWVYGLAEWRQGLFGSRLGALGPQDAQALCKCPEAG